MAVLLTTLFVVGSSPFAHAETPVQVGTAGYSESSFVPPFDLVYPLDAPKKFSDTFGDPRGADRLHQGLDLFAPKLTSVVAAADGVVVRIAEGRTAGISIELRHKSRWVTRYLHINNDTPGTDDGLVFGIAEGIGVGSVVAAGQIIAYSGDSGNAEGTSPHLHFELRDRERIPVNPYSYLRGSRSRSGIIALLPFPVDPVTNSLEVVGKIDPGGGFNTDVWVHGGVAYLGVFGHGNNCSSGGVRMFDVSNPTEPTPIGLLSSDFGRTSVEAVWAGTMIGGTFEGDIAIVAHRACKETSDTFRGLAIYDVTDPAGPALLSTLSSGADTLGFHGFDVLMTASQTLVVGAVPNSLLDHPDGLGDVRVVDITDPRRPFELSDWDARRDTDLVPPADDPAELDETPGAGQSPPNSGFPSRGAAPLRDPAPSAPAVAPTGPTGPTGPTSETSTAEAPEDPVDLREFHAHGVTVDAATSRAFVAHWDAGVVVLDLTAPDAPTMIGGTQLTSGADGNAHSIAHGTERDLLLVSHQDLDPLEDESGSPGWGYQMLFDAAAEKGPGLLSAFSTDEALPDEKGGLALDGRYTVHEAVIEGKYAYSAWYSSGLHILDLSDPNEPVEVASFVPPVRFDPRGHFRAPNGNRAMPLVWSVVVVDGLIYVSDANTGLWILRFADPPDGAS